MRYGCICCEHHHYVLVLQCFCYTNIGQEDRLVGSLDETVAYMNMWSLVHGLNYELIIVDDGSKDRTAEIVHEYMKDQKETMTLLQLHLNSGKGAALKVGVQEARGSYVLIVSTLVQTRSDEGIITSSQH